MFPPPPPAPFSIALHVLFYAVLAFLKEQESVLAIALVQRQQGLVHRAQNEGTGQQGFALALLQPAGHCWASCVSALCSSCPVCTRMVCDTAEAAGGLHGGKRCRWAAWW